LEGIKIKLWICIGGYDNTTQAVLLKHIGERGKREILGPSEAWVGNENSAQTLLKIVREIFGTSSDNSDKLQFKPIFLEKEIIYIKGSGLAKVVHYLLQMTEEEFTRWSLFLTRKGFKIVWKKDQERIRKLGEPFFPEESSGSITLYPSDYEVCSKIFTLT